MSIDPAGFLEGLVRIRSHSGREREASGWLVERMVSLGFTRARVDEAGNAVGELGTGPRTVMLLGHIDTVPGDVPVRREADRLFGRGTVDAKGPLAAFSLAAAAVGARPGWKIVVCGAVEEESATSRGARHMAATTRPDACIIGEPSGWDRICLGYKGRLLIEYRLSRPMSHTAGREPSACETALGFWNAITALAEQLNRGKEREFDKLTPSLRRMESGCDGLHETVEASIGLRVPVGLATGSIRERIQGLSGEARIEFSGAEEGFRSGKNNALVRSLLQAIRAQAGKPGFSVKTGTSDMNVVGPIWGCPIVAYGPGDSALDHTPHEHIRLSDLEASIRVLRAALEHLTVGG